MKDVTWGYADADKNVLEGASVVIHKGEAVAFIGESGSGKTTLADIILGLYEPKQGEILSDGKNVYKYFGKIKICIPGQKGKRRWENDNGRNSYKIIYFFAKSK